MQLLLLPTLLLPVASVSARLVGITDGEAASAIPEAEWEQAMNRANATGHFPIAGYDTSKPPGPNTAPIDGWSLDFNVTADISLANAKFDLSSSSSRDDSMKNGFVTGASIRLNPPASLLLPPTNGSTGTSSVNFDNTTWSLCVNGFDPNALPQSTIDAGKNDNGSCVAMFGEQCVLDIRATWAKAFSRGRCFPPVLPESCKRAITTFSPWGFGQYSLSSLLFSSLLFLSHHSSFSRAYPLLLKRKKKKERKKVDPGLMGL